ncbi:Pup--protein ligase [Propionibacteriaceae bacterium Y2011]
MDRRIYGLETEYGVTSTQGGGRRLTADEIARSLFRSVVTWGRSSNVFLANGSRLYLDVGSHPEYATPECDDVLDLIAHDRAGELIVDNLARSAEERLAEEGHPCDIYLFKNNTDSHGNSYGCHENYLIPREGAFSDYTSLLVPFLVSRQLITGAGKVLAGGDGTRYVVSQRAEHIWESVSSATTRSRPIINTRDEPHADPERFRRLHVIVGDSSMSQTTTMLKVATTELVLQLVEQGVAMRDLTCDNPIRAIRDLSRDLRGRTPVRLANGRTITGLELQREYLTAVTRRLEVTSPVLQRAIDLWDRTLTAVETGDTSTVDTEIDWAIKQRLLTGYATRHGIELSHPRIAQLDLAYHDIRGGRGIFRMLEDKGMAARLVLDEVAQQATIDPPQTTRARLRGRFIAAAQAVDAEFTADWVHLKVNDQAQRTVLCKDPFVAVDERVDRLIAGLQPRQRREAGPFGGLR